MVIKKAIKDIQMENCDLCPNRCTDVCRKCHYGATIKALELQIPKKVENRKTYEEGTCPKCGFPCKIVIGSELSKYCRKCGQRLK